MPGLIGYTDRSGKYDNGMLSGMLSFLKYFDWYDDEDFYSDGIVNATGTHLGVLSRAGRSYGIRGSFSVWLDGEFCNRQELQSRYGVISSSDEELFCRIYSSTGSFEFLKHVDGSYAAVFYDMQEKVVYLVTDRYGFKPLYWTLINDDLVWSSELKGFLGHDGFAPVMDRAAVAEFFDFGYHLENRTWFDSVELVPASAVLAFDLVNAETRTTNYWSWDDIAQVGGPVDETEAAVELGRLFRRSVEKRIDRKEKTGVTLSGGLDSRAILAAVPGDYNPLHTFTFGKKGCDDIEIARVVSAARGARHHILDLNSENWLAPRFDAVWSCDGAISLLDMHGCEFCGEYKSYIDSNLNGLAGDLVCGGSYLEAGNLDRRITAADVRKKTGCSKDVIVFNEWYNINKTDPYFINNRVRRFTNSGLVINSRHLEQKMPFFDNDLVEFVYSLPDRLRYGSRIYKKMLLKTFPEYFRKIPWQATGCPISYPDQVVKMVSFKNRVMGRLKKDVGRFGFIDSSPAGYTDYAGWLRQEPAKSIFEELLLGRGCIYPEYVDRSMVRGYLRDHMEGKADHHNELCLALTFELWLQQIFEGKYRR